MNSRTIKIILSVLAGLILFFYLAFSLNIGRTLTPGEFIKFSKTIVKASVLHPAQNGGLIATNLANRVLTQSETEGQVLPKDPTLSRFYTFPLPKYTTGIYGEEGVARFVTFASQKEIKEYFDKTLPENGWSFREQLGALYIYQGQGVRLNIEKRFYLTTDIKELEFYLDIPTWTTYTNEKHGYSIEYPANWYFHSISADSDFSQLGPYDFKVAGDWYVTTDDPGKYNIASLPKNPFEVDFRIYKVDPRTTFARFFPEHKFNITEATQDDLQINGLPAYRLVYATVDSNTNETHTTIQTFIKHNDRIFMFAYSGHPILEENGKIAEHMLQSFKVK